jgi:hypothetical protein
MFTWVIHDKLARGQRPGYSGERGRSVPRAEVDAWMLEARAFGIKSIICLLSCDQLPLYDQLPNGLIAYYRAGDLQSNPFRPETISILPSPRRISKRSGRHTTSSRSRCSCTAARASTELELLSATFRTSSRTGPKV